MATVFDLDAVLPGAAVGEIRLPRKQAGTSPQGMAVTLLADYTLKTRAWLPSAAIVTLLAESGVTSGGARAAISRLTRRGVLETKRYGRHTSCRLTGPAAVALANGAKEIVAFAGDAESWDGKWTLVAFSIPQESEARRRTLRGRLRWMGYAPLYDALWISPHGSPRRAAAELDRIGIPAATVFRAERFAANGVSGRDPLDAWDLPGISERYDAFVSRWSCLLPDITAGTVSGSEALRARTEVMETYRQFIALDPRLPARLMPDGWLRERARDVFTAVYDGLSATTLTHVLDVITRYDDNPRPDVVAHSVADLLTGVRPWGGPPRVMAEVCPTQLPAPGMAP